MNEQALIDKLETVTVARGATAEEAANARRRIEQLRMRMPFGEVIQDSDKLIRDIDARLNDTAFETRLAEIQRGQKRRRRA